MKRFIFAITSAFFISTSSMAAEPTPVVASFSILGDIVQQVGGDKISMSTLVEAGEDAHSFSPSAQDSKKLKDAKIIFINGLGFEPWAKKMIATSGSSAQLIAVSDGIKPIEIEHDHHGHAHHGHDEAHDPHAWNDPRNGIHYVRSIEATLSAMRPDDRAYFKARSDAYIAQLDNIHANASKSFAAVPQEKKVIILSHDSMGYFAAAYGLTIKAPQGLSTDIEPKAKDIAKLIKTIKTQKISAIFIDSVANPKILERISAETGVKIGGKLYSDALTQAGGEASGYIELLNHNIKTVLMGVQ